MDPVNEPYPFERPVILLAAPRSGSTLLFESLAQSSDLWTIGGESHAVFESIHRFNPLRGQCNSNAITAADANPAIIKQIRLWFYQQLRDADGQTLASQQPLSSPPRLLEKTPKNALRVSLLNALFPDALYVYLFRNPRENISSILDAWRSGRFVTYPNLPGRNKPWSMLLPPGWESYHHAPPEEIAAFQWRAANTAILKDLSKLPRDRWMGVSYGQQVQQPEQTLQRICDFCGVSSERIVRAISAGESKLSRHTLTPPAPNKWHKNAAEISSVIPTLAETIRFIRETLPELPDEEFDLSVLDIEPATAAAVAAVAAAAAKVSASASAKAPPAAGVNSGAGSGRNARCHCGSGKRFKHCHGDPRRPEGET